MVFGGRANKYFVLGTGYSAVGILKNQCVINCNTLMNICMQKLIHNKHTYVEIIYAAFQFPRCCGRRAQRQFRNEIWNLER